MTNAMWKEFERTVASVFRAFGHTDAQRMLRLGAHDDRGDITGLDTIEPLHIDCKYCKAFHLAAWLEECKREANGAIPVVIVHRRQKSALHAYVVLELQHFAPLVKRRDNA